MMAVANLKHWRERQKRQRPYPYGGAMPEPESFHAALLQDEAARTRPARIAELKAELARVPKYRRDSYAVAMMRDELRRLELEEADHDR